MNTNETVSHNLKQWRLAVPASPCFKAEVWKRVETKRRHGSWSGFGRSRQGMMGAACLMALVVSGWSGHSYARSKVEAEREALADNYFAQIDVRTHSAAQR